MNEIVRMPWVSEEVEISCPRCGSDKVILIVKSNGCYDLLECHRCGYKNEDYMSKNV